MLEQIKLCGFRVKWNLREVHKITAWKDDCVYRTKSIGMICCLPEYKLLDDTAMIGSISTKISRELM